MDTEGTRWRAGGQGPGLPPATLELTRIDPWEEACLLIWLFSCLADKLWQCESLTFWTGNATLTFWRPHCRCVLYLHILYFFPKHLNATCSEQMILNSSMGQACTLSLILETGETGGHCDVVPAAAQVKSLLADAWEWKHCFSSGDFQREILGGSTQRHTREAEPKEDF